MPDEKRIKDFEPATELLIDDWFAVDSPSQGTRKMQASMFQEGLQTQITTNTENIALHSGQISVLQQGVGNIGDKVDVLDAAITVEEYSATKLYAVDEDCVYEGVRYKCITAIETPEAFDPNKWQAISIEGELNELNSSLANTNTDLKNLITQLGPIHWTSVTKIYDFLRNTNNPIGLYFTDCRNASDNPFYGIVSLCLIFKASANGSYSVVFIIAGNRLAISDYLGTTQTALTWHSKVSPLG